MNIHIPLKHTLARILIDLDERDKWYGSMDESCKYEH
jgi:hypothetical protein